MLTLIASIALLSTAGIACTAEIGAQPNEEIQAGADFLMQIQQRGEAKNNDDHRSPTNLRPSYGFGLA